MIIYAVEKPPDSYKFNLLHNKQLFINQLKANSLGKRTIDEGGMDEQNGLNFSEYVAILPATRIVGESQVGKEDYVT